MCRDATTPVSQPILFFISLCGIISANALVFLISLCGNFSLVPNCGARHAKPEHTSEKKGNNWNCPLRTHVHTYVYYYVVIEAVNLSF